MENSAIQNKNRCCRCLFFELSKYFTLDLVKCLVLSRLAGGAGDPASLFGSNSPLVWFTYVPAITSGHQHWVVTFGCSHICFKQLEKRRCLGSVPLVWDPPVELEERGTSGDPCSDWDPDLEKRRILTDWVTWDSTRTREMPRPRSDQRDIRDNNAAETLFF